MSHQTPEESNFFNEDTKVPQASQEVEEWRNSQHYDPPFGIERWRVIDEVWNGKTAIDAVVLVDVNGRQDFGAAQGVGRVADAGGASFPVKCAALGLGFEFREKPSGMRADLPLRLRSSLPSAVISPIQPAATPGSPELTVRA